MYVGESLSPNCIPHTNVLRGGGDTIVLSSLGRRVRRHFIVLTITYRIASIFYM